MEKLVRFNHQSQRSPKDLARCGCGWGVNLVWSGVGVRLLMSWFVKKKILPWCLGLWKNFCLEKKFSPWCLGLWKNFCLEKKFLPWCLGLWKNFCLDKKFLPWCLGLWKNFCLQKKFMPWCLGLSKIFGLFVAWVKFLGSKIFFGKIIRNQKKI